MDANTASKLTEINRRFYAEFGKEFSSTRQRIQPGVRKVLEALGGSENILDLGCGNGELARVLSQQEFKGTYLGLDFSIPLLKDAGDQPEKFTTRFSQVDLTANDWDAELQANHYDIIFCFAALHHIPGEETRGNIVAKTRRLLKPGGRFMHSNWQFLNSEKLKARIQPWEKAGIPTSSVDIGDYLLDWRAGGNGLRYVHHFSEHELNLLAIETGFTVVETFLADGEGGRLSLYQIWSLA